MFAWWMLLKIGCGRLQRYGVLVETTVRLLVAKPP
jgi:hypothetical protein